MASKQKVVICGAGNAAHVFTTLAASNPNNEVHLISLYKTEAKDFETALTETDDKLLTINVTQQNRKIRAAPVSISNDPRHFADADVVILSLPAFAHNQYLNAIKQNIQPQDNKKTLIAVFPGASGLECEFQSIFGANNPNFALLSCITLPWACRIIKFGQSVEILGTKNQIEVCVKSADESDNKSYIQRIASIIGDPPHIVDNGHIFNMSLGAIKVIVHPSIMYGKWKDYDGKAMNEKPLFYQGIDQDTADIMSALSNEVLKIKECIEKETGLRLKMQHISKWYMDCYGEECGDTSSLYKIITTNPAYKGLTHPMIQNNDGQYIPDWKYRYLSEDIPFGLIVIRGLSLILSEENQCDVPLMDKILKWAQAKLGKEYLKYEQDGSVVAGKDIGLSRAPQRYGIKSIKQLI